MNALQHNRLWCMRWIVVVLLCGPLVGWSQKIPPYMPHPVYVHINQADEQQLRMLPGIGKKKAHAIVVYRKTKGRFRSVMDILNVPGIQYAILRRILNHKDFRLSV